MNYILSEQQLQNLFGQSDKVIEPIVVKLFKFLNEEKKKHKNKEDLLKVLRNLLKYLNIPAKFDKFLLEVYLLNYREDGDYSSITKENFVDPRKMKGIRTTNKESYLYTSAQLPFKGSNLEGQWSEDGNGVPYYVVKSYGWYPVYLFKDNIWYEALERYSSSTSKQMRHSDPIVHDDNLDSKVVLVTRKEMEMLQRNATLNDILKYKANKLKEIEPELQKKRIKIEKGYGEWDSDTNQRLPGFVVKFKINSIEQEGDKSTVVVDVYDVLKKDDNKGIPTPENYLKGELPNVTKEKVEDRIKWSLKHDLKQYFGPKALSSEHTPEDSKIDFKFNHLKK